MNEPELPNVKKKLITWNRKEMLYGFIVIFLLLTVYYTGQLTTLQLLEKVERDCPGIQKQITYISPFGINYLNESKGTQPNLSYVPNTSVTIP